MLSILAVAVALIALAGTAGRLLAAGIRPLIAAASADHDVAVSTESKAGLFPTRVQNAT